jgi:flagellar basal-body rod modification protein FlgD
MSGSIGATTQPTTATTAQANGRGGQSQGGGLSADFNTFLTLLTTQLRNQDPSQPMDANQLTQQLVQFATVEQALSTNQKLDQMLALQQAGQMADAASLVGRRVAVAGDTLPLQDGTAQVNLPAAGRARTARIDVTDAAGTVIRQQDVQLGAGATAWRWDGRDQRGTQRPDGAFRVSVAGRAADGTAVTLDATVTGRVTGVGREGNALVLRMGAASVGFDRLRDLPGAS